MFSSFMATYDKQTFKKRAEWRGHVDAVTKLKALSLESLIRLAVLFRDSLIEELR